MYIISMFLFVSPHSHLTILRSIIPSEDAHQSEYVAASDRRREYICGYVSLLLQSTPLDVACSRFSGSAGTAIVTPTEAYFITDSRYWVQASRQLDSNWQLVRAGARGQPKDWADWLVVSPSYSSCIL